MERAWGTHWGQLSLSVGPRPAPPSVKWIIAMPFGAWILGTEQMTMLWNDVKAWTCLARLQNLGLTESCVGDAFDLAQRAKKALSPFLPLPNLNTPESFIIKPNKL